MSKNNNVIHMLAMTMLLTSFLIANAITKNPQVPIGEVAINVPYTAPADGYISLALFNEQGQLVRSLLYAKKVKAGKGTVTWDGASDLGVPQPAGNYTTKAIFFDKKPSAEYIMSVGKSGNPPYRTPDGKGDWGGNLGKPGGIFSNSNSVVMVWTCVEDNQITGIQEMDSEGGIKMRYFSFYPWDSRLSGTGDDKNFYLCIRYRNKKSMEVAEYVYGQPRGKKICKLPVSPLYDKSETRWRGRYQPSIEGMTLNDKTVFVSVRADNAIYTVDRQTHEVGKIQVKSPGDIAYYKNSLIAQSGNKIVRLGMDGKILGTIVKDGVLKNPNALALDKKGGFYTTGLNGQIGYFNFTGKLLKTFGKKGGLPKYGKYESNGFGEVEAITVGCKGESLWVQDTAVGFPRTSRWSLDGKLMKEWFVPKHDLWKFSYNPGRPTELVRGKSAFSDYPGIRAYQMDLANKKWCPSYFYPNTWAEMFSCVDVYKGYGHGGNPLQKVRNEGTWPIFHFTAEDFVTNNGKHYFINAHGNNDGAIYSYSSEHKPKPVALVGFHHVTKEQDGTFQGSYDQGPNQWITWADLNNDGKMSKDEIILSKDIPLLKDFRRVDKGKIDKDLNVLLTFRSKDPNAPPDLYVLPPKKILPSGVPIYDWSMIRKKFTVERPDFSGGDGSKKVSSVNVPTIEEMDDGIYSLMMPGPKEKLDLPGIDGSGWWASRNWRHKLVKNDKQTGKLIWAVGRRAPGVAQPGQMYHPASLSGKGGDFLYVPDTLGPVWIWHEDGLLMGHLFKDHQAGEKGVPSDQEFHGEIQTSLIFTDPKTNKVYHVGAGGDMRIHEMKMPDVKKLPPTTVKLSPAQAKIVKAWDPDGVSPDQKPTFVAHRAPGNSKGRQQVKVDGKLDGREGWSDNKIGNKASMMLILLDGQQLADVSAMYDDKNLYLGYRVKDAAGPKNSGSELPYSPFVSGAYVDFYVAPNWTQPQRREVKEGDVRVLVANIGKDGLGSTFQQGFWQKKKGGAKPQTISSPVATIRMDHIDKVPGLQMAYGMDKPDKKAGKISYTVEIAVPLASLGLKDVSGKTIGFDASVGIANPQGDQRERAAHWAGLSEGRVVDRPGSTKLLPHTWGKLKFGSADGN